jgi:putative mRNA 3-end processing factor
VYLAGLDLWLDSRARRESSLISHAHTDHIGHHSRPVLTPATLRLLHPLWRNASPLALEYGQAVEMPRYTLTLHPAGHMLGSAQALVVSRSTGERLLYTGDLKLHPNPTAAPVQAVPCDTLVLDATYGRPCYVFPPEGQVLDTMEHTLRSWLRDGCTPVVLAYPRGKAQELLHHLLARGFRVTLEKMVYEFTKAYEDAGVVFRGEYGCLQTTSRATRQGEVVLASTGARRNGLLSGIPRARLMAMTGWAVHSNGTARLGVDAALPYSDHADYPGLVEYVGRMSPKRVFTVGSFPELANHLRRMGCEAYHMGRSDPTRQLPLF